MPARILVVEDHGAVRRALSHWLKIEFPQYILSEAISGEEAIIMVSKEKPDLVVIDLNLPGMSGINTAKSIKANKQSPEIVILATHEDKIYRDAAKEAGASAYISKHEMLLDLIPAIRKLLENGASVTK